MASDGVNVLGKVTMWLSFVCGILTLIEWCFLLPATDAKLEVASNDFLDDINKRLWRDRLFSFRPDVFVDIWTPFVMGFISILCHFKQFNARWLTAGYIRLFFYNFVLAMFGNLGYAGGIGIIVGSFSLLATLLCLIMTILSNDECSLDLEFNFNLRARNAKA